ncbi:MAG: hypothetical protein IKY71_00030 [Bacteroidaceae bacterium]|nr:hypothetical protein [Bacteroidaceae bacterium]
MLLTVAEIILVCVVAMTALSFAHFVFRGAGGGAFCVTSTVRLIWATLMIGLLGGAFMAVSAFIVLPTYYIINDDTPDGYDMRFVLNGDFFNECGLRFVENRTDETFCLVAKVYGDEDLHDDEEAVTMLPPGKTGSKYGIDGWFEPFPLLLRDDSNGTVERFVMRQEWVERELEKEVQFYYEPD